MVGAKMATRLSIPVAGTSRRLAASRVLSTSSSALVSSKIGSITNSSGTQRSTDSASRSLLESLDPPIPEAPRSKLHYQQTRISPPRRPSIKPPPTLALPSSMLPPSPRVPLPMSLPGKSGSKMSEAHEKIFDIYMNSLSKRNDEPTLKDLDALRPPPSTIRAALQGVIGSGRALLPPDHTLHLALEQLGAQEATVGGGPKAKKTVVAGSRRARKLEYKALYAAAEGMIARSFTVVQLKQFDKESRMEMNFNRVEFSPGKPYTKPRIIHDIMNSRWGMIHPEILKGYIDAENQPVERLYPVSPFELFIFLGRDGENLLHLSEKLKMHISVDHQVDRKESSQSDRSTTRPGFIIRASGTESNHEKLGKHIEDQRNMMIVRVVPLPTGPPLSPSLLQSISRIAGAFVENVDPKFVSLNEGESSAVSVSITAPSHRTAYTAERLVQRAAMEIVHRSQLSLLALLKDGKPPVSTTDEEQYALYPFGTQGLRVRRVQRTESTPQNDNTTRLPFTAKTLNPQDYDKDEFFILTGEDHPETKSPVTPNTKTVRNVRGEVIDLKEHILGKSGEGGERIITVTFGHVVFKAGKSIKLDSPLPDLVSSDSMLEWANKHDSTARIFVLGPVPSTHLASNVTSVHRLQYRAIEGGRVINFDVKLPDNDVEPSAEEASNLEIASESNRSTDGLELIPTTRPPSERSDEHRPTSSQFESIEDKDGLTGVRDVDSAPSDSLIEPNSAGEDPSIQGKPNVTEFKPLPVEITVGTETTFELMLPESTMDICIQVSNATSMAKPMVPEVLNDYLDALSKFFTTDIEMPQPDPPQYLDFDGERYILVKNTSARSGISTLANLPPKCIVTSESSLDLENNVRTTFTQLIYQGERSKQDWNSFIEACQTLASKPYEQSTGLKIRPT